MFQPVGIRGGVVVFLPAGRHLAGKARDWVVNQGIAINGLPVVLEENGRRRPGDPDVEPTTGTASSAVPAPSP
jgi:hypothetical protein